MLVTPEPLPRVEPERLPVLLLQGGTREFQVYGYGAGSFKDSSGATVDAGHGMRLLRGDFVTLNDASSTLSALATPANSSVCDGDSGAPAIVSRRGVSVVVGLLSSSDFAADGRGTRARMLLTVVQ